MNVNKQTNRTKQRMRNYLQLLAIFMMVLACFAGCKKHTDDDSPQPFTPNNMQKLVIQGTVTDINGVALGDVLVTSGKSHTTTTNGGSFIFTEAEVIDNRAIIKFEKSGYFTLTRSGLKQDEMYIEVILVRKGNSDISLQTSFESSKETTLKIGEMKVYLPASSIKKADGSAYSGAVNVDMLYLDPNNENFSTMMPGGDLAGIREDNSEAVLISYGMTNVNLTDNSGNPLQLKGDNSSTVTFPIPAGLENNPPITIPLWSFNEKKGIWIEEGFATLQGDVYIGTVTHFSWINCDYPEQLVTIKGVVVDCKNQPVPNIRVTFRASIGETNISTNSKGEYSNIAPANTPVNVSTSAVWGSSDAVNVPGQPGGTVYTVQNLKVDCGVTIKGRVVDCDNKAVRYTLVKVGVKELYTNTNGDYSTMIGPDTPVTVTAVEGPDSQSVPGQPGGTVFSVRDLLVCDSGNKPETWSIVEKGSVKYEQEIIFTWDNHGYRFRYDVCDLNSSESSFAYIINHLSGFYVYGSNDSNGGTWYEFEGQDYKPTFGFTVDEKAMANYQQGTVNIAGKTCNLYVMNLSGYSLKQASWNGLMMLYEINGEIVLKAVAATVDIPEVAFTETFEISWLP